MAIRNVNTGKLDEIHRSADIRMKQAAVLFEVIATQASNLQRVMSARHETHSEESILCSVEFAIAQLGLLADHGTGLALGSDVPGCKGSVEDWLLPPTYFRPLEDESVDVKEVSA
ncbi:MAG: hypothetical protein AAF542_22800 [Pseudomonadota bacterium]